MIASPHDLVAGVDALNEVYGRRGLPAIHLASEWRRPASTAAPRSSRF
jgi:hypothetical protein